MIIQTTLIQLYTNYREIVIESEITLMRLYNIGSYLEKKIRI